MYPKSSRNARGLAERTSCSSRAQTQFLRSLSVHSPFDLRSTLVRYSLYICSTFVFSPFQNGKQTAKNGKKRRANDSEAKKKRISSELAANVQRISSKLAANLRRISGKGRTNKTFMSKDSFLNCRRVSSYFVLLQTDEVVVAGAKTNLFRIAQSGLPIGIRM